jgi:hypothetical protein
MMALEFITASYVAAFELACDGDIAMARDAGGGLHVVGFLPTRGPELSWHRPLNRSGRSVSLQTRTVVAIAALVLGVCCRTYRRGSRAAGNSVSLAGFAQICSMRSTIAFL